LHTVGRVFNYEDIPKDKKVNLVALGLKSKPLSGGPTYVLKELRKGRVKSKLRPI